MLVHGTAVPTTCTNLNESSARRIALAVVVLAPTRNAAVDRNSATVSRTSVKLFELSRWSVALAVIVAAPADERSIVAEGTGVPPTRVDLTETAGWSIRLAVLVAAPADHGSVFKEATGVGVTRAELPEGQLRYTPQVVVEVSPAYGPTCVGQDANHPGSDGDLHQSGSCPHVGVLSTCLLDCSTILQ